MNKVVIVENYVVGKNNTIRLRPVPTPSTSNYLNYQNDTTVDESEVDAMYNEGANYTRYSCNALLTTVLEIELEGGDTNNLDAVQDAEASKEGEKFRWSRQSILLFIDEYEKLIEKFRNPKYKKKDLWNEIAGKMKNKGYTVSSDALDKKMRNMRSTYIKILDNNKTKVATGRGRIAWEYFDRFEEVFARDKSVKPVNVVASSQPPKTPIVITENGSSPQSTPTHASSVQACTPQLSSKWKRLDVFRKKQLEIEAKKVEEIKNIRIQMETFNEIQKKKLDLFEKYLNSPPNSQT
ncbi:uncharacterized protein LOC116158911 isoform X1 [Photinus pyralis]|uniref:uncharacterized protein LOC116158911 isoform X1 n=1 Tax=Photinus pyralis TaxID=7054 RepID=UPI0012677FCA|nr:uncharacterized protein LOC116158911 isoform X1 [Photinus pyralis]